MSQSENSPGIPPQTRLPPVPLFVNPQLENVTSTQANTNTAPLQLQRQQPQRPPGSGPFNPTPIGKPNQMPPPIPLFVNPDLIGQVRQGQPQQPQQQQPPQAQRPSAPPQGMGMPGGMPVNQPPPGMGQQRPALPSEFNAFGQAAPPPQYMQPPQQQQPGSMGGQPPGPGMPPRPLYPTTSTAPDMPGMGLAGLGGVPRPQPQGFPGQSGLMGVPQPIGMPQQPQQPRPIPTSGFMLPTNYASPDLWKPLPYTGPTDSLGSQGIIPPPPQPQAQVPFSLQSLHQQQQQSMMGRPMGAPQPMGGPPPMGGPVPLGMPPMGAPMQPPPQQHPQLQAPGTPGGAPRRPYQPPLTPDRQQGAPLLSGSLLQPGYQPGAPPPPPQQQQQNPFSSNWQDAVLPSRPPTDPSIWSHNAPVRPGEQGGIPPIPAVNARPLPMGTIAGIQQHPPQPPQPQQQPWHQATPGAAPMGPEARGKGVTVTSDDKIGALLKLMSPEQLKTVTVERMPPEKLMQQSQAPPSPTRRSGGGGGKDFFDSEVGMQNYPSSQQQYQQRRAYHTKAQFDNRERYENRGGNGGGGYRSGGGQFGGPQGDRPMGGDRPRRTDSPRRSDEFDRRDDYHGGPRNGDELEREPVERKCYNCGGDDHTVKTCPRPLHCTFCDRLGHTANVCFKKNNPKEGGEGTPKEEGGESGKPKEAEKPEEGGDEEKKDASGEKKEEGGEGKSSFQFKKKTGCFNCGLFGHTAKDCREELYCTLCDRKGHTANKCKRCHNCGGYHLLAECPMERFCYRCNREGHTANICKADLTGEGGKNKEEKKKAAESGEEGEKKSDEQQTQEEGVATSTTENAEKEKDNASNEAETKAAEEESSSPKDEPKIAAEPVEEKITEAAAIPESSGTETVKEESESS